MGKKFKSHTLKEYSDVLSQKQPVPGGGSAAAYTAAMGLSLYSMVTQYSLGKSDSKVTEMQLQKSLKASEGYRKRFLDLVDLDAEGYMNVVKARKLSAKEKKKAERVAAKVPKEICKLCYKSIQLAPLLVVKGNKYLVADVKVGSELLLAAFNSALALQE